MNLTPSQSAAVEHRGSSLLVAASAGSGKTEVLARRCVSLIADPASPCAVDRLLVVTFTRAAAAELRVRIARMLHEEATRLVDADLRRHLRRQELLVETADIGTIDAWCGRVLREHFAEAGVDVDFSVLGEQDAALLRREVLDELFDEVHRGGDVLAREARAWIARATSPGDGFLRSLVSRLNAYREHLVNPDQWFERQQAACVAHDAESVLAKALTAECRFQGEQLAAILAESTGDAARVLRPYADQLAIWQGSLAKSGGVADVLADIGAFKISKPRRGEPTEPPVVGEVRERWLGRRLQERWSPDVVTTILRHAPAAAELAGTLLRLEERYQQMLGEVKRRQATYEFADVLRMTLDLLGTPAEDMAAQSRGHATDRVPTPVAHRLQQRYEHILVDEYQDTSPVQVEILRLVTRTGRGRTNRFMVGDVKQSIYGFRQAEPRLFAELIGAFEAGREDGRVEYLSDNFRSHADVLAALNRLFGLLLDPALGGTQFGEKERLRAGRDEIDNPSLAGQPRVEMHVIEQDARRGAPSSDEDADEVGVERIEREAQLAADRIRDMLAAGVQVPQRNADGQLGLRPLRLADCVVLLRSARQNAGLVARVLRANDIRCVASGRETLLDVLEVRDVCNVLQLLVNRRQDVALAAYLRGPLVGLTPTELLHVRAMSPDRHADLHDAVEVAAGGDGELSRKLKDALGRLDRWSALAREEELPALLQHILQDGSLPLFARALPGGEQRVAALHALQNIAATFAAGGQDVADFVAYLDALAAEEIDLGTLAAGGEDVVRIMTIHGAKGLEFPIVFLLGAGARFNEQSQREALLCDESLGLGLRFADYPARATINTAGHHVVRLSVAQRELEEELRLLYVATTRARERLFIVGHASPDAWNDYRARYVDRSAAPPLISRLSVRSRLEWVLMAAATGRLHEPAGRQLPVLRVVTHEPGDIRVPGKVVTGAAVALLAVDLTTDEQAWVERGWTLLSAPVDRTVAELPAVLSVSAAKELARRESAEDQPYVLDMSVASLRAPTFVAESAAPDGREVGTACHRFLEVADLTRLTTAASVRTHVDELVAAGRLSAQQGRLVPAADVAWLGTTAEGLLLAQCADRVRREVPFVHAVAAGETGEQVVVRGIIDCLVDVPAGLVIFDYKTDQPRDDGDFAARVAGYTMQMQLYAGAAGAIFARPVSRAVLVFLRARRVADVPLSHPPLAELLAGWVRRE